VAVTFDDGYADNLHQAAPLLRDYAIPATVFVVSGVLPQDREFWWDELERVVFEPAANRTTRELNLPGRTLAWAVPDNTVASCDPWQAWTDETPTPAHAGYRILYRLISALPPDERRGLMDDLIEQAGLNSTGRPTHRALSCEELQELARSPLIEIGAHTASHPALSKLSGTHQAREVLQGKSELEALTGTPVRFFAYPYGKREHYNRDTIEVVRSAGFDFACVNEPGLATLSVDRLQIPRVVVPALDGPDFARWLGHCLSTLA
jgi:peptidoglycan/xylan/chitin deacetylase (PgdA/CDA1 family)